MHQFKVWRSLTEPIIYQGLPLDFILYTLASSAVFYVLFFGQLWVMFIPLIGLPFGWFQTRRDRRWFEVLVTGLKYFSGRMLRRVRYVC